MRKPPPQPPLEHHFDEDVVANSREIQTSAPRTRATPSPRSRERGAKRTWVLSLPKPLPRSSKKRTCSRPPQPFSSRAIPPNHHARTDKRGPRCPVAVTPAALLDTHASPFPPDPAPSA